jgi:dipeptidyl aminopeptidase/acylaminoacyl peptidase
VTSATVLKSVNSIEQWDQKNIFIWGHSNGGQIALTTLEITEATYPTVLWAPVGRPFPASILYYIDEADDGGKLIINKLSEFYETYDASKFSLTGYLNQIKAPIMLNQGTADTAVPYWWSDSLVKSLKTNEVDVIYSKYPGANHSLVPSWNSAVENSLSFYKDNLTK